MRKKLLTLLLAAVMVCSLASFAVVANAGLVERKPAGEGLITSTNVLNSENFRVVEVTEGDAAAYQIAAGADVNRILDYNNGEYQELLVNKGVPAATMAKGARVDLTLTYLADTITASDALQLKLIPGAASINEGNTYGYVLTGGTAGLAVVPADRTAAKDTDPVSTYNTDQSNNGSIDFSGEITGDFNWTQLVWSSASFNSYYTWGFPVQLIKFEMTVNANKWVDVKIWHGVPQNGGYTWTHNTLITNWAPYDGSHDFYANTWLRYADNFRLDNISLTATYTEEGTEKTDVIVDNNLNDPATVITAKDAQPVEGAVIARGIDHVQTEPSGMKVVNPALGTGLATRGALEVDSTLADNYQLNAKIGLTSVANGQKVGVMYGLENGRVIGGAHRYVYLTNDNNVVKVGAEEVDAEGNVTQLFDAVEVTGAAIAGDPIDLIIKGKYNGIEIYAGSNEAIAIESFDLNGFLAITHKGEGDISYMLEENVTMTGYEFLENEGEAITSSFDGNYINTNKFQFNSTVTPDTYMVKGDTTTEDLLGLVAKDGKLGFYGTSTGTRLITAERYADFVMQFDYTSVPTLQRGQLTGISRQSQFYIIFGMKEGGLAITEGSVYALGIYEGSADVGFYGNNGTVVSSLGMATKCWPTIASGYSTLVETDTPDANSIPKYAAGGYDPTKENNNVETWYNDTVSAGQYSFYNKTSRIKLVAVNNKVALYAAEVNTETGAIVGDYYKFLEFNAVDTEGYLGVATDAPGWAAIDNFAITPVSREAAIVIDSTDDLSATGIVADVAIADMDADPAPTPLARPVLTADTQAKKVTWEAVEGAKEYTVTVKLDGETVIDAQTVEGTEIDLSSLTEYGSYRVTVVAIPADTNLKVESRETVEYVLTQPEEPTPGPGSDSDPVVEPEEGSCMASVSASAIGLAVLAGAIAIIRKRKN